MALEQTLSIIKPDAVEKNLIGQINARIEACGLKIIASRMLQLDKIRAAGFYAEHQERGFFQELVDFMSSGPLLVQVLQGDDAINQYRLLMGATDPQQAEQGTIRSDFADSINANAVHGSDSQTTAMREISYFFSADEICI